MIRRVILSGTGPQGGEGMDSFKPKVAEHATQETPVVENFLYLFFAPSETSQAAGRAFWDRRHGRAEQGVPSSMAAMGAQADAIAGWGVVPETDRYGQLKKIKQPVLVVNVPVNADVHDIKGYLRRRTRRHSQSTRHQGTGRNRHRRRRSGNRQCDLSCNREAHARPADHAR